jgi:hypothetical protein
VNTRTVPVFGSVDDLMIALLKDFFDGQDIHIGTLYASALEPPIIIARRERRSGQASIDSTDDRFIQSAIISINTITSGPDADQIGEELQEACRIAIREAQQNQTVFPGLGSISSITNSIEPSRVADWATSTGQVQYASLPKGWTRFESVYRLLIRSPHTTPVSNRFVTNRNTTPTP